MFDETRAQRGNRRQSHIDDDGLAALREAGPGQIELTVGARWTHDEREVHQIAIDNEGDVVLAGMFSDIVDFDPDPLSEQVLGSIGSRFEGFVLRLNQH